METNKDFWDKVNKLEELAKKVVQEKQDDASWGALENLVLRYCASANPDMLLEMIAELKTLHSDISEWKRYAMYLACYIGLYDGLGEIPQAKEIYSTVFNKLRELNVENKRLDKEAEWFAEQKACKQIQNGCCCGHDKEYWRKAARKAVENT